MVVPLAVSDTITANTQIQSFKLRTGAETSVGAMQWADIPARTCSIVQGRLGRVLLSMSKPRHPGMGSTIPPLLALTILTGCSAKLPACNPSPPAAEASTGKDAPYASKPNPTVPAATKTAAIKTASTVRELLVGIDGSGSMLGHAKAGDPSAWRSLLQSVNLAAQTLGLKAQNYRVGGGTASKLPSNSTTAANNPCFFQGCAPYPAVSSSLQTLWQIPNPGAPTALRLLISDLEVNQNDISTLVAGIKSDVGKGSSAGILALKLPFDGQVFDSQGQPMFNGSLNRPLYLLATGPLEQVKGLLDEIRKIMAQKGVQSQELSLFGDLSTARSLTGRDAMVIPPEKGAVGVPVALNGERFNPGNNPDYRFIQLKPGATGFSVRTIKPWSGGTTRPDLGLVRLERVPLTPEEGASASGVRINKMLIAGSQLRLDLDVDPSTPSGALRATVASLPEQWWIDWDRPTRSDNKPAEKAQKTDGLLLLLNTLSTEIREARGAPPAARLCMIFQTTP